MTQWSRVHLEKLAGTWLVKFSTIYGTRMFITVFTRAHHGQFRQVTICIRLCEMTNAINIYVMGSLDQF